MQASSSKQSSRPVDMTPQAFQNLQGPFASVLANLLGIQQQAPIQSNAGPGAGGAPGFGTGGGQIIEQGGRGEGALGPGAAGERGRQQAFLTAQARARAGLPQQQQTPQFTGAPSDPLSGIPQYQGPLTAGLGQNEQTILDQLMGMTGAGGGGGAAQDFLRQQISGSGVPQRGNPQQIQDYADQLGLTVGEEMTPDQLKAYADQLGLDVPANMTPEQARDFVDQLGLGYSPDGSLSDFAQQLAGAAQTTGYDPQGNNPFVAAAIEAATRPILQQLEEQTTRTLPGRFTQAGQFTQPGGSSAFDRAAAIATRGAAQEIGDISSDISFRSFEAERGRQFEAEEGARAREAESLAQELERRGQYGEAARAREAAALESTLDRSSSERETALERRFGAIESEQQRSQQERQFEQQLRAQGMESEQARQAAEREAGLQRQQEAALQLPGVQSQEVETMLANLQAQALPRLIQDLGIERGLEQFNTRVNNLLTTLGITAGVTRPVISQQSSGSSGSVGIGSLK